MSRLKKLLSTAWRQRISDIDDVVQWALFLVSNDSKMITRTMEAVFSILSFAASTADGLITEIKSFALELSPHNIRVNSVAPTMVNTDPVRPSSAREKGRDMTKPTK